MFGQATTSTATIATNDHNIDGLLSGSEWPVTYGVLSGSEWTSPLLDTAVLVTAVSYSFTDSFSNDYENGYDNASVHLSTFQTLNSTQRAVAKALATQYMSVSLLSLYELTGASDRDATIRMGMSDPVPNHPTAYSFETQNTVEGGDIFFNRTDYNNPVIGNYAYHTFGHELGHSLGLKHGQETGGVSNVAMNSDRDSMEFSIMTYRAYISQSLNVNYRNEDWGFAQSLMMYDIRAIQQMYGASFGYNSTNTTYTFSTTTGEMFVDGVPQGRPGANRIFRTIWDGNGTDTYDFSNYDTNLSIDLTPGGWSDLDVSGNFQAANLNHFNGTPIYTNGVITSYNNDPSRDIYARGQVFNALQFNGDARSLIENANGGAGNDKIVGNSANNLLRGNGGIDELYAGTGNDFLYGDADNDYLDAGDGNDQLYAGTGNDQLYAGAGNDWLLGGDGNDQLHGQTGDDSLAGETGDDTLHGGAGNDFLYGDAGNDYLDGGDGNDQLYGQTGDNTLHGGAGNDWLIGGDGNDELYGGYGNDILNGGAGHDKYFFDADVEMGTDIINETTTGGIDLLDFRFTTTKAVNVNLSSTTTQTVATGVQLVIPVVSLEQVYGGSLNDNLSGNSLNNTLLGGDGNDTLNGVVGNDSLNGGTGEDNLDGGVGADTMSGGAGNDAYVVDNLGDVVIESAGINTGIDAVSAAISYTLTNNVENLFLTGTAATGTGNALNNVINGNAVNNTLSGYAGNDNLFGGAGNDALDGGTGEDNLNGGIGADTMSGGAGNDSYIIDHLGDVVIESAGIDTGIDSIQSSVNYTLVLNVEELVLTGTANLNGTGNNLSNFIRGNIGNNIINGGGGSDTLVGGLGVDWFQFSNLISGVDTISDLVSSTDKIAISAAGFGGGLVAGAAISTSQLLSVTTGSAATSANQRFIYNSTNGGLYFDADGSGALAAVQFAHSSSHPTLAATDFVII